MAEILHHLRNPGMMIPLQLPTNNGFSWCQVVRNGFRPSTNRACSQHPLADVWRDDIPSKKPPKNEAKHSALAHPSKCSLTTLPRTQQSVVLPTETPRRNEYMHKVHRLVSHGRIPGLPPCCAQNLNPCARNLVNVQARTAGCARFTLGVTF